MSRTRPERRPVDRRTFLTATGSLAALTLAGCGGGGGGASTTTGARTTRASAPDAGLPGAPDDPATLAYVLKLAQVESDLYRRALGTGFFRGGERDTLQAFGEQEDEHVATLSEQLRAAHGRVPAAPQTTLALPDRETTLGLLLRIENLAAAAYLGQLHRIKSRDVLATLQSIHTVEGRHAAALAMILGKPITPNGAFARPENMATVLQVVDGVYLA